MSEYVKGLSDPEEKENDEKTEKNATDLLSVSGGLLYNINWKVAIFIFIISIFIFSDLFAEGFLKNIDSSFTDGTNTTNKGTIAQILTLVASYIGMDLLVKYEIL